MLEELNPVFEKKDLQTWLYLIHQEIFKETDFWEPYTNNRTRMEQLLDKLWRGKLPEADIPDIYETVYNQQFHSSDIAYILGLRHGMEMKKILEKGGKITDLLDD